MKHKRIITAATMMAVPAFAALLAMPVLNSGISASAAQEEFDRELYAMGDTIEDLVYEGTIEEETAAPKLRKGDRSASLPSSVDLSESPFFPPIGHQMGVGSCYAWSSTYYQFTYEANKMNNIESTAENAYSPAFVFNFRTSTRGRRGAGGTCTDAYEFLMEHGAPHMSEMPYQSVNGASNITRSNYDYSLSTDTDAMINALNTRVSGHGAVTIPGTGTPITGPQSESLNQVKKMLADGKVFSVRIEGFNWDYNPSNSIDPATGNVVDNYDAWVAYRGYRIPDDGSGHAMTVVGYDDSIWYDFNGNGQQEEAEFGAFKVANSWGTGYYNDGYIWVMYDALNRVSAVEGNWQAGLSGTRIPIFDRHENITVNGKTNVNAFYYMEVENKDVYYVGQLDVNSDDIIRLTASLQRSNPGSPVVSSRSVLSNSDDPLEDLSYDGTLVFDYAALCDPIGDYISGHDWYIRLNSMYNTAAFRITDNLSNTIVDFGTLASNVEGRAINLMMGDVNYDGAFDQADIDLLNSGAELSNLQKYLAVYALPDPTDPGYTASAEVVTSWNGGQIVMVTVTNTGSSPVNGWALNTANLEGSIVSVWGADLLAGNIFRCASYNATIPVGGSVTFGYQIANPGTVLPTFTGIADRTELTNTYVAMQSVSEWGDGFCGTISIYNSSSEALVGWEVNLRTEGFTITDAGAYTVTEKENGTVSITCGNGEAVIPAGGTIIIYFTASKTGTPVISDITVTALNIG